ncbi:hypothetical protein AMIS_65250 [Actinoplanes missouriensis 431]|uniref:Uncharacterized protein n=1 Tax=Actinoplanes missouriensis (strain ATCC 14538 / DSM 43046 / CBS 188.64 / JCM 3121 / NBRC 102363 / NCIMB 12654 / NRRL B-3342 / UNCC 431) TaxID=512565 RepID=I0HFF8_ACTM4|nr:DUF6461 domain-containing protein [Actinoplanes missouriensis]BAL91745.1 hypothetical protein AMIS_65250 [Actinoplanes missouriensis 431]
MKDPIDLVGMFGEGWCVTLTRGDVFEALSGMEVDPADCRSASTLAEAAGLTWDTFGVLLVAREIGEGLTLVLEFDGSTGWVGADLDVLALLSAAGGMACSIYKNPHREELLYASGAALITGLDPATFRRWGRVPDRFDDALSAAGFPGPDGEGGSTGILVLPPSKRAVAAMTAITGIAVTPAMFDGPWMAGPSAH